jgi:hypothetical protein
MEYACSVVKVQIGVEGPPTPAEGGAASRVSTTGEFPFAEFLFGELSM